MTYGQVVDRVIRVFESCNTLPQVDVAKKYCRALAKTLPDSKGYYVYDVEVDEYNKAHERLTL